jgi:predicted helicase
MSRRELYRCQDAVPEKDQKDTIIYNSHITISNIPAKAYEYVVNGKIGYRVDHGTVSDNYP